MLAHVKQWVLPAAADLLPSSMRSTDADRELMAIAWQESRLRHRAQIGGPARGFWQFELGGVRGVLDHRATALHAARVLEQLQYRDPTPREIQAALQHNDVLAAVFARLLLWTLPEPLPTTAAAGWNQYLDAWRPGKPHPATWADAWEIASRA